MRSIYREPSGAIREDLSEAAIAQALSVAEGLLWVDLDANEIDQNRHLLLDVFGFHPLAVADALEERHVPKLDDWEQYLYIGLHEAVLEGDADTPLNTHEVDIFVGRNYMVTHQAGVHLAITTVWDACQRDERLMQRGATHLLYRLADELADGYMQVIDGLDEVVDHIEDRVLQGSDGEILGTIMRYKRALLRLRRVVAPQREVINKLARGDDDVLDDTKLIYFRDVYDHYVRLADIAENLRDLISGALDTHLSVINNRMNEVMKTLTVITVLFAPLTFITGFFGMNFFEASGLFTVWTGRVALYTTLGLLALAPVGMVFWLRRRAWM